MKRKRLKENGKINPHISEICEARDVQEVFNFQYKNKR
jgi:hypothetical protein